MKDKQKLPYIAVPLGLLSKGKVSEMGHAMSSSIKGRGKEKVCYYKLFNWYLVFVRYS